MSDIGISALQIQRDFSELTVFTYQIRSLTPGHRPDAYHVAAVLGKANHATVIASSRDEIMSLVSLGDTRPTHWDISLKDDTKKLFSHVPRDNSQIRLLVAQSVMYGVMSLEPVQRQTAQASWEDAYTISLVETQPSSRVEVMVEPVVAYKTLRLSVHVLPSGVALIETDLSHHLSQPDHITIDWVSRNKPDWLRAIHQVENRYASPGQPRALGRLIGRSLNETPDSPLQLPDGEETTYLDYHLKKGHITPEGKESASQSVMVEVSYGGKSPVSNLGSLLSPVMDLGFMARLDSYKHAQIAKSLLWSVTERIRETWAYLRQLHTGDLHASLGPLKTDALALNHLPDSDLVTFGQDAKEKRALCVETLEKAGALTGMKLLSVTPVLITFRDRVNEVDRMHMLNVEDLCHAWSKHGSHESPIWHPPIKAQDAEDLAKQLDAMDEPPTVMMIVLDEGADKRSCREVAYTRGIVTQFMRLKQDIATYSDAYYHNLAAGLYSKAGGVLMGIQAIGETTHYIGVDLRGESKTAFLYSSEGIHLAWVVSALDERAEMLADLMEQCLQVIHEHDEDQEVRRAPRVVLHTLDQTLTSPEIAGVMAQCEALDVVLDIVEIHQQNVPRLYRTHTEHQETGKPRKTFHNPLKGDCALLMGIGEAVVCTTGESALGAMSDHSTARPLRLRHRAGKSDFQTLAQQVVALAGLHGSSLHHAPRLPVTLHHGESMASLRRGCTADALEAMPKDLPIYL